MVAGMAVEAFNLCFVFPASLLDLSDKGIVTFDTVIVFEFSSRIC